MGPRPSSEWFDHALHLAREPGPLVPDEVLGGHTISELADEFLHRAARSRVRSVAVAPARRQRLRRPRGYLLVDSPKRWWLTRDGQWFDEGGAAGEPPTEVLGPILLRMALLLGVLLR